MGWDYFGDERQRGVVPRIAVSVALRENGVGQFFSYALKLWLKQQFFSPRY